VTQLVEALPCSRKVAGSIPEGITGIFHLLNPSGLTIAPVSTQPLTEMSTPGGQRGPVRRAATLPPSCAVCLKIWKPQPPGTLRACPGLYRDCCTLYHHGTSKSVTKIKLNQCFQFTCRSQVSATN